MVTLNLSFKTDMDKTMVLRIPDPVMDLTTQQIQEAASAIVATGVIKSEKLGKPVQTGVFGADMKVELLNDGPVTIWIDSKQRE